MANSVLDPWTRQDERVTLTDRNGEVDMDVEATRPDVPVDVRDGDVLVYMHGKLMVVDHLAPEAFTIDLLALEASDARRVAFSPADSRIDLTE